MMDRAEKLAGVAFPQSLRWRAFCLTRLGRRDEARNMALKMEETSRRMFLSAEIIAHTYASLGERGPALKWLQKGYEQRSFSMPFLDAFPAYDFLRGDKQYEAIRMAMRLPAR
jgi:hypothetical protein